MDLTAAYDRCQELHRRHGRTYYLATRLLPAWKRRHVHALYGFTRYADEIVDQTEAMTMGERIVVMNRGRIQQVAPPLEVYERPANAFVAGFIGTPPMNLFPPGTLDAVRTVGLRPEHLALRKLGEGESAALGGSVDFVEPLGSETLVHVVAGETRFPAIVRVPGFAAFRHGDRVELRPEMSRAVYF